MTGLAGAGLVAAGPIDGVAVQARLQPRGLAEVDLASGRQWSYAAGKVQKAALRAWLCGDLA